MARITHGIHSVDGMDPLWLHHVTPVVVEEESAKDLTLVDTCFVAELSKLEAHLHDEGYDIRDVKRLVLTHTHPDHVQAALEVKKISGARIYAHWAEARFKFDRLPVGHEDSPLLENGQKEVERVANAVANAVLREPNLDITSPIVR